MREIKFRAWLKESNEKFREINPFKFIHINHEGELFSDENVIISQFTGLLDKNGKEIYEGDILKSEYNSHEQYACHPVVFKNGSFTVDHNINNCCKPWRGNLYSHHNSEEIIGNIYENPDLIKN